MAGDNSAVGGTMSFPDLFRWAAALFKSPRTFFKSMEKKGGYLTPCLYAAAWMTMSSVVSLPISLLRPMPTGVSHAVQAAAILVSPFAGLFFGFFVSAFFFLIWHLVGSKEDFQTSFRVWAFLTPLTVVSSILGIVPFLNVALFIYGFYLLIVASQEVHGVPESKSWAVWGGVGGLVMALMVFAFIASKNYRPAAKWPNPPQAPFPGMR